MTAYETLRYEVADGILTLWLSRPESLNAFTVTMADELESAFDRASADDDVAAIVVTGEGRAFCAGMDLSSEGNVFGLDETQRPTMADVTDRFDDPAIIDGVRDTGGRVSLAVYRCTKPVIAAINGAAVGIGATMTLPMDVRIASEKARIGFVFGRLGIVPEACSTWFLPRIVGISRALELVYAADILDAHQALDAGLVREVVPADELLPTAYALARRFVEGRSQVATALMRQMMYRNSAQPDPVVAHQVESLAMFYASIGDGKEGVAAFLEKRAAEFTGRRRRTCRRSTPGSARTGPGAVHGGSQAPEGTRQPDTAKVVGGRSGLASLVAAVEPTGVPVGREPPQRREVHHVAAHVSTPLEPHVHACIAAEDALVPARVDHVVPHPLGRREEVRDLVPGGWRRAPDVPGVRCAACEAPRRDQQVGLLREQVRHGEGIPGATAPPEGRRPHDREAQRDRGERVRHDDAAVRVEHQVLGGGQSAQAVVDLSGRAVELVGQFIRGRRTTLVGEGAVDRKAQILSIHRL